MVNSSFRRTRGICVTWQDRASLRDEQKAVIKFIAKFKFSEILIYQPLRLRSHTSSHI